MRKTKNPAPTAGKPPLPSSGPRGFMLNAGALFSLCFSLLSCNLPLSETDSSDAGVISFDKDIVPIFKTNCAGCHDPGGSSGIVMYLTDDPQPARWIDQPSTELPQIVLIDPGSATTSMIYLKVATDPPPVGDRMPRFAPPLAQPELNALRLWIEQGALDN